MKYLTDLLKKQVEYNFYKASDDTQRFIVGTARSMTIEWLKLFQEYLPPPEVSEHAKGAHDAVKDLLEWINVKDSTVEE